MRQDGSNAVQRARAVRPHRLHLASVGAAQRAANKAIPAHSTCCVRNNTPHWCLGAQSEQPLRTGSVLSAFGGTGVQASVSKQCRRQTSEASAGQQGVCSGQSPVGRRWRQGNACSWELRSGGRPRTACCWGRHHASRSSPRKSPSARPRGWKLGSTAHSGPAAARQPTGTPG